MATKKRFQAVLEKDENSEATGILIPFEVKEVFGTRARVPVRGAINGFAFRGSVFPMGEGRHYMAVNKELREGAKAKGGDTVSVVMERDDNHSAAGFGSRSQSKQSGAGGMGETQLYAPERIRARRRRSEETRDADTKNREDRISTVYTEETQEVIELYFEFRAEMGEKAGRVVIFA